MSVHVLDDLCPALREVLDHLTWNFGKVGAFLLNRTELDAEPFHQL
jgi:hypothetical protein